MTDSFIEKVIKDNVEKLISDKIELEIEDKVNKFKKQLEDNKDQYIAEVMKGIRIMHRRSIDTHGMDYRIIFDNVVTIERGE